MQQTHTSRNLMILAISAVVFYIAHITLFPFFGSDYYNHFYLTAEAVFQEGAPLYGGENTSQYGQPPWLLPILWVGLQLPLPVGQAFLTTLTLVSIILAVQAVLNKTTELSLLYQAIAIFNLHTMDLVLRGNVDGFAVLGFAMVWWAYKRRMAWLIGIGFWFVSIKPIHFVLFGLAMLWGARAWTWREKLWIIAPVAVSYVISALFLGPLWGVRFVRYNAFEHELYDVFETSLWKVVDVIGLPGVTTPILTITGFVLGIVFIVTRTAITRNEIAVLLAMNVVFAPYVIGSHYVVLAPVLAWLMLRHRAFALLWFFTLTPLLRTDGLFRNLWIDSFYAIAMLIRSVTPFACVIPLNSR
ncbi:MAG: hypothetical protein AAFR22_25265, partial [Chloroflexota bacterium]